MGTPRFKNRAFSLFVSVALLAGCSPGVSPAGPSLTLPPASDGRSALTPEAQNQDLIYVSDISTNTVSVFSWRGRRLRTLNGFGYPTGLCSDAGGNVYVTDQTKSLIIEYARNGTMPIKRLKDPGQLPNSCAVNAKTGDLAVVNWVTSRSGNGSVSVYKQAKGNPKVYGDLDLSEGYFCGYDDMGDLFVDGISATTGAVAFAELPAGGARLQTIGLNRTLNFPGGVQWDGTHVAVGDADAAVIYQVQVSGSKGKVVGSTRLGRATNAYQFWIGNGSVAAANENLFNTGNVLVWRYPAGGNATKAVGQLSSPFGLTVSVAPK